MNFSEKLSQAIASHESLLIVGLDPNPEMLPQHPFYQEHPGDLIQEMWDWLDSLIIHTQSEVCAYKLSFGFYKSLGSPGLELLLQVIHAIPNHLPIILDTKHGDLNTSTPFARTVFEEWQVDAITINPYSGQDLAAPFLVYPDHAIFVNCRTSNPAALTFQDYPNSQSPLYLQVVKEVRGWGTPEQLCLEVGTDSPEILAKVRAIAPERLIWLRSLWQQEQNLKPLLKAGLNDSGEGLLIPVPQDWLSQENPLSGIQKLRENINQIREEVKITANYCDIWMPDLNLSHKHPHEELILQLFDIHCILFGDYVQASGATFSYYIDLRKIISNPQVFHQVLNAYAEILEPLEFDRIAGLPYGALPTATGLSLRLHHPMIFPRKEVKAHGTRRVIEGNFIEGEKVVIIDDILISGKSAIEGAKKIKFAGLRVEDIVVFIDHGKGVKERLKEQGYNAYSVLTLTEIAQTLYECKRINSEQYQAFFVEFA